MKKPILYTIGYSCRILFMLAGMILVFMSITLIVIGAGKYVEQEWRDPVILTEAQQRSILFRKKNTLRWLPNGTLHIKNKSHSTPLLKGFNKTGEFERKVSSEDTPLPYLKFTHRSSLHNRNSISPKIFVQLNHPIRSFGKVLQIPFPDPDHPNKRNSTWSYDASYNAFHQYNSKGHYCGTLGATGFVDTQTKAEPFGPFRLQLTLSETTALWITERQVYRLDLDEKSATKLLKGDQEIITADIEGAGIYLHLVTEDGMHYFFDPEGDIIEAIHLPSIQDQSLQVFAAREKGSGTLYLWGTDYTRREHLKDGQRCNEILYRIHPDGTSEEIHRVKWTFHSPPFRSSYISVIQKSITSINPVWLNLFPKRTYATWPLLNGCMLSRDIPDMCLDSMKGTHVWGWIIFSILLILIGIGWKGFRGFSSVGWILLTVGFGIPGLATWLLTSPQGYICCDACGKRILLQKTTCRCKASIPAQQHLIIHDPTEVTS